MRGIALALALTATAATAQEATLYDFDGTFDDAAFVVEEAIVGRGLVVDFVSHVGDMLNRTREDVGGEQLFDEADIFLFCSAVVSREVIEANPMNVAHCPYGILVVERAGEVFVGYRNMPEGEMQAVQELLDQIAQEATGRADPAPGLP